MDSVKRSAFMRRVGIGFFSLYQITIFITTAVILSISREDCSTPIRNWLITIMSFYITHPIFSFISEIILYHLEDNEIPLRNASWIINIFHTCFAIFYVIWFIVGNVLYFVADGCSDW
jgi:hypothetical protein